ncbi:hypothetical protein DAPPUDRAFT_117809 [Daphnia pulex]|uniref:Uncharacterized protein n=1 Tax=Daphnia pulex TaxID=6669 RepID=E9HTU8_DAPPU|nr:hypothetical protein DAPPUDRAFT_117809 [Daphnia pulex]|eukprot:EFX64836.1 hypothetical protein DAPPUDRAFT_117809 [Daphnia pulex]
MARNKKRDARYSKSRAVKESAKNAAKASALKRRQQKEERERLAGDQEPVIDFDTVPEAQDREEEAVAVEEPVEEPVEKPVEEPDEEPGQELVENNYLEHFEVQMPFLEFKRNVTMGLLSHALNENKNKAGRAGRMMPTIHPSAEPGAKRRKSRLSVRDDIRFTGVGLHLPIWGGERQKRNCFVEFHDENYLFEEEAPLAEVEAVYSASEESDGQASDHEPTNKECSSSSTDSDELEDTNRREGFIIDEYDDFKQ